MKYNVIRTTTVTAGTPMRFGKRDVLVFYATDGGRNDHVSIPEEDFNETALDAAVGANEQKHGAMQGQTREI